MPNISKVVIGTWPLSGDLGAVEKRDVYTTLEYCMKIGIREFDTAPNYGNGIMETIIGDVFRGEKNAIINTKCGNDIRNKKKFDIESLEESFYGSLERLKVSSVNILFLHNPRDEIKSYKPIHEFFEKERLNGTLIKKGISLAKDHLYKESDLEQFDIFQNDLNLLYLSPVINDSNKNKIFYARSPLATGLLAGKINKDTVFGIDDFRSTWLKGERLRSILLRIEKIKSISNIPLISLARKFLLEQRYPMKVIFGVKNIKHVDDIIEDLHSDSLEKQMIEQIIDLYKNDFGLPEKHKSLCY